MSWLRRIWLPMLVLGTLMSPRLASAQAPLGLVTRVGGLDLAAQVIVGVHGLASAGSYLGNPVGYDESASGCSLAAGGTEALATRAGVVHGALHPVAQRMRTTAVLETSGGRVVAGGGPDLTAAQRALLGPGESAARLPGAHAELTALTHAQQAGATPQAMAVTRTICPQCAAAIEASGGTVTSPTTAVWPR